MALEDLDDDLGSEPATKATVTAYLTKERGLTATEAAELLAEFPDLLARGEEVGSFAYYVGDRLMNAKANQILKGGGQ